MANLSSQIRNYLKLELLIERAQISLRQLFKNRYSLFNNGQIWDESSLCGNNYTTNVVLKNKKLNLTPVQKISISNGNSNEWDITTLIKLILYDVPPKTLDQQQLQQIDQENKHLEELTSIRNQLIHHPSKSIDDIQFNQLWNDLTTILIKFGDLAIELDKLKNDSVFAPPKQPINEENLEKALRFNSLGTHAHKDGKYSEAIALFTQATTLSGISNDDRAFFYSNMSSSHLALYQQQSNSSSYIEINNAKDERYKVLQNAKEARFLLPIWWKGHFRVGKAHASLDDHEEAVTSFERAFALDPTKSEIEKELDESRLFLHRQVQPQYLDPNLNKKTMPQILNELKEKYSIDPESVRKHDNLSEKIDPAAADVLKGHKYELGDIDIKQDYKKAAKYFARAASQGNAEGMYNLARLTDYGLGVEKDHRKARKLLEQAAEQPAEHPILKGCPNVGVAESEHALGVRYFEGISVRKNLSLAAYWYQRASDHGSAMAANNLGSMYLDGLAVPKDLDKAEQYLELGAKRGDPLAMLTLAEMLLNKNDLQMAKIWYDRSCAAGNIVAQRDRNSFLRKLEVRQKCSSNETETYKAMARAMSLLQIKINPSVASEHSYLEDYKMFCEYAKRGSITAKQMRAALEHFMQVLNIVLFSEILTKEQEETLVHELSQCYRIEPIVAQYPYEIYEKVTEVVKRVLTRCTEQSNSVTSLLDEDARLCYVTLNFNSYELIDQFLSLCKKKYPKSIYFHLMSGAANGFLRRAQDGLYDINNGLEIEPNNYELLYHKAVLSRHLRVDMDEATKAYQTFINVAPKDHRKVPEAYYEMALCNPEDCLPDVLINRVIRLYMEGQQAEKLQLPCFLPYKSENIAYVQLIITTMGFDHIIRPVPVVKGRKQRLTDPHRVQVITKHREWEGKTLQEKTNSVYTVISTTLEPRVKQQTAKSLTGLKPITLREMDPTKDQVYHGYVLSVTIIEKTYSWIPSIHLVIEDENFDCERMLIYGFPKQEGQYLISELYTIGTKIHVINPYLRIPIDRKVTIRVDDLSSIILQNESEQIVNMCRYCCEANAAHVCGRCRQARYCSKECQKMDWKIYKHKLICKNN